MTTEQATKTKFNCLDCFCNTLISKEIFFAWFKQFKDIICTPYLLFLFFVSGVFSIFFVSWISFGYQKGINAFAPNKPVSVSIMQSGKMQKVQLKPLANTAQHTDLVGTSEQPTIDGGIINAADGLAINHFFDTDTPVKLTSSVLPVIHKTSKTAQITNKTEDVQIRAIEEKWATSKRVKRLLQAAAQEGKLDYVLHKIDEKGLPASLATVPMIESNYQIVSTSNKGAAGLWQLMPSIAKDYGISSLDRYHFQLSTTIALDLLDRLHQQFGSWALAFAAYNAGSKRVELALRKNPKARSIKDLDLPKETKQYVSRIMSINKKLDKVLL